MHIGAQNLAEEYFMASKILEKVTEEQRFRSDDKQ